MASTSGTATGAPALLAAINSFMTGSASWTLHDTVIAANDLVFKSAGTNNKNTMYMRLTINTSANNPYKDPIHNTKVLPGIIVRGYHRWDNATHIGANEYGIMGPILTSFGEGSTYNGQFFHTRIDSSSGAAIQNFDVTYQMKQYTTNTTTTAYRRFMDYVGSRWTLGVAATSALPTVTDLITGEVFTGTTTLTGGTLGQCKGCHAYDATTDKWFFYVLPTNSSVQADSHLRYDLEADTWVRMASVPWAVNQTQTSWMLWDGTDTIYIVVGNATTNFYKYSISGNTYTSLAVTPVALGASTSISGAIYVPTTVTGFSADVIYLLGATAGTTLYCYNITSNTWNNTGGGTPNLTVPQAIDSSCGLVWDHTKYAYFFKRNSLTTLYRMDLTATGSGWNVSGSSFDLANNSPCTSTVINHPAAFIRCTAASSCNYWIVGDADSIVVVTKLPISSGRYYWSTYGKIQTRRRSNVATSTGSASAGTNVSIAVDSSTGYLAGDYINIFDPSNATQENCTIYAIPDATHIQVTIANNYTSGSFLAADPFQTIITGDTGFASAPIGPSGYKKDFEIDYYLFKPSMDALSFATTSMDGMGYIEPIEGVLVHHNQTATSQAHRYGIYGTPLKVYLQPQSSYPGPQSEDILSINGQTYQYFSQQSMQRMSTQRYGIVIGPL